MPADSPEEIHTMLSVAMNAGDLDAFMALYEEEAALIAPPDGRRASGRDAIREATAGVFALRPVADFQVIGKLQHDGLAVTNGRWQIAGTDPDGGRVELAGRGTLVSRRQPDGRWLIVLDNAMTPS
jgi:uncharacterized protein (TIGR02246 family)